MSFPFSFFNIGRTGKGLCALYENLNKECTSDYYQRIVTQSYKSCGKPSKVTKPGQLFGTH